MDIPTLAFWKLVSQDPEEETSSGLGRGGKRGHLVRDGVGGGPGMDYLYGLCGVNGSRQKPELETETMSKSYRCASLYTAIGPIS